MPDDTRISWIALNVGLLRLIQKRSTAAVKVAAILEADHDHTSISFGYNGTPSGTSHPDSNNEDHKTGYEIHAEVNCLSKAPSQILSTNLWVTHKPCMRCAHVIVASKERLRISTVYYLEDFVNNEDKYHGLDTKRYLEQSGIELICVPSDTLDS